MKKGKRFYYLIHLQYLGFRLHGWQKQKDTYRTVQGMLDRTIRHILEHDDFKTLGASRTDSMVSAEEGWAKLTVLEELNTEEFFQKLNYNLPQDLRVLAFTESTEEFRIINDSKTKIYHYYFSNEVKSHPFSAPFMTNFRDELNIEMMQKGAEYFQGTHFWGRYCYKPTPTKQFVRTIETCRIIPNTEFTASFFPTESYVMEVIGSGFMRNQIRLMMGTLVMLGRGQISFEDFKETLIEAPIKMMPFIAPASGLILKNITLEN